MLATGIRSAEEVLAPTQDDRPDRAFGAVVVDLDTPIVAIAGQRARNIKTLGLVIAIMCWRRYRPISGSVDRTARSWTLIGLGTRSVLRVLAVMSAVAMVTRATGEIGNIVERASEANDLEPLVSRREYKRRLFMTNINVPSKSYFAESAGYGVCDRGSIGLNGELKRDDCKAAQMRRQDHWSAQRPEYFFYFKQRRVFPGFATCPRDAYLGLTRGGAGCNEELGEQLASQFQPVASNDPFDVYDLNSRRGPGAARGK